MACRGRIINHPGWTAVVQSPLPSSARLKCNHSFRLQAGSPSPPTGHWYLSRPTGHCRVYLARNPDILAASPTLDLGLSFPHRSTTPALHFPHQLAPKPAKSNPSRWSPRFSVLRFPSALTERGCVPPRDQPQQRQVHQDHRVSQLGPPSRSYLTTPEPPAGESHQIQPAPLESTLQRAPASRLLRSAAVSRRGISRSSTMYTNPIEFPSLGPPSRSCLTTPQPPTGELHQIQPNPTRPVGVHASACSGSLRLLRSAAVSRRGISRSSAKYTKRIEFSERAHPPIDFGLWPLGLGLLILRSQQIQPNPSQSNPIQPPLWKRSIGH